MKRLLLVLLSLLSFTTLAALPGQSEFLPVESAYPFASLQRGDTLSLDWTIQPGYYLYRDRITLTASDGVVIGKPQMPEGDIHDDAYFGEMVIYTQPLHLDVPLDAVPADGSVTVSWQGCAQQGLCYPPVTETISLAPVVAKMQAAPATSSPQDASDFSSLLGQHRLLALAVFFGAGVLLAFTPCVLPLLPILSSVLAGAGPLNARRGLALSLVYVQGMALTYAAVGLAVAFFGLQLQAWLQHPLVLGTLAILFVLLALSMFGLFTLQLPSSWQSRAQTLSSGLSGGRYASAFGMGILAGLVATPCTTAPLSGALIYVAQSGDLLLGAGALYLLGFGMGLPLIAIGASGGKLLMRGGAWMNGVKRAFGYMLLAAALLFGERLLPGIVMRWLWVALAAAAVIDLLWWRGRSWRPVAAGIKVIAAAAIIAMTIHHWQLLSPAPTAEHATVEFRKVALADLDQALAEAASQGKPAVVDLYADWCVACKELEHKTFPHPAAQQALSRFVALRVDLTTIDDASNALLARYQVVGLPTLLLFDSHGQEHADARISGFIEGPVFAERLDQIP